MYFVYTYKCINQKCIINFYFRDAIFSLALSLSLFLENVNIMIVTIIIFKYYVALALVQIKVKIGIFQQCEQISKKYMYRYKGECVVFAVSALK